MNETKLPQSAFMTLKARDFLRGALIAILTAVIVSANELIAQEGEWTRADLWVMGKSATAAFIAYLGKNFFTKPDTPQQ